MNANVAFIFVYDIALEKRRRVNIAHIESYYPVERNKQQMTRIDFADNSMVAHETVDEIDKKINTITGWHI